MPFLSRPVSFGGLSVEGAWTCRTDRVFFCPLGGVAPMGVWAGLGDGFGDSRGVGGLSSLGGSGLGAGSGAASEGVGGISFEIVSSAGLETAEADGDLPAVARWRYPIPSPAAMTPATMPNPARRRHLRPQL